jgi:hypothetical protein
MPPPAPSRRSSGADCPSVCMLAALAVPNLQASRGHLFKEQGRPLCGSARSIRCSGVSATFRNIAFCCALGDPKRPSFAEYGELGSYGVSSVKSTFATQRPVHFIRRDMDKTKGRSGRTQIGVLCHHLRGLFLPCVSDSRATARRARRLLSSARCCRSHP